MLLTLGTVESVIQICQPGVLKFLVKNGKIGVEKNNNAQFAF